LQIVNSVAKENYSILKKNTHMKGILLMALRKVMAILFSKINLFTKDGFTKEENMEKVLFTLKMEAFIKVISLKITSMERVNLHSKTERYMLVGLKITLNMGLVNGK